MKLRTVFDFLFTIPAAFVASREEEINKRVEGL